jgi:hypothetical protein
MLLKCLCQARKVSSRVYMCTRGIDFASFYDLSIGFGYKLEKKYAPVFDNYGQSCFVRSDFFLNEVCL